MGGTLCPDYDQAVQVAHRSKKESLSKRYCCCFCSNSLGQYFLGKVARVFPGRDGRIRKVALEYKTFRVGFVVNGYSGCTLITIISAMQRLALLVPVENQ